MIHVEQHFYYLRQFSRTAVQDGCMSVQTLVYHDLSCQYITKGSTRVYLSTSD